MSDKIRSALVGNTSDGKVLRVDVISFENKLWLVPHWLEVPQEGCSLPARIVRFDTLRYQPVNGFGGADYLLNDPVPKSLLERESPKEPLEAYEYVELPEIRIPASIRPLRSLQPRNSKN